MPSTEGIFQFMSESSESSLYRNSKVKMIRLENGDTGGSEGVELTAQALPIVDAREAAVAPTCERNGFELLDAPLEQKIDFLDHKSVVLDYYPLCEALVANVTGATAYAFDHNIRSASGQANKAAINEGQNVQGPAHVVHGDYTLQSAPDRLAQLGLPPSGNDTLRGVLPADQALLPKDIEGKRYAIINVWRNIVDEPVVTHPLALCDAQTVDPDELVVFEIHYTDRIGENYFAKHAESHRMYYYPEMTKDEALLIKQWDSAGALAQSNGEQGDAAKPDAPCTFSFHSAFDDPSTPEDAPDRWSIEVRCMVIYED